MSERQKEIARAQRLQHRIDLTGTTSFYLTYVKESADQPRANGIHPTRMIECLCACGRTVVIRADSYLNGNTKSCGCYKKEILSVSTRSAAGAMGGLPWTKNTLADMTGKKFGRLTVLRRDTEKKARRAYWIVRCDCGKECSVSGGGMRDGNITSCGCYRREAASQRMKQRASRT